MVLLRPLFLPQFDIPTHYISGLIPDRHHVRSFAKAIKCMPDFDTILMPVSRLSFRQCGRLPVRRVVEIRIHRVMDNVSPKHVDSLKKNKNIF